MMSTSAETDIWEVLQTEFQFDFQKGPRQIPGRAGLEYSRRSRIEFLFCKRIFFFGSVRSIARCMLATRRIVMSKKTTEKLNLYYYSTIT